MDAQEMKERIRNGSDLVVKQFAANSGIDFGLNRASVEWVDGLIEWQRQHPELTDEIKAGWISKLGSFLGECLVANTEGHWEWNESYGTPSVVFPNGNCLFPIFKVEKQFDNGREGGDSILGFYDTGLALTKYDFKRK